MKYLDDPTVRQSVVERMIADEEAVILRTGPKRWVCKACGEPRRRAECLSCGNEAPLTDEPRTSGLIR